MRTAAPAGARAAIELGRERWGEHLERISHECAGLQASLLAAAGPGRSPCPELRLPLRAIAFDRERELIELALGTDADGPALRCLFASPARLLAGESAQACVLAVLERDGEESWITLRRPPVRRRRGCERTWRAAVAQRGRG